MRYLSILLFISAVIFAGEVGRVERYKGKVDIVKQGALRGSPVDTAGPSVGVGDVVRTKTRSYALVTFIDGTRVELKERSRLKVISYEESRDVNIQKGIVKFEVKSQEGLKGFKVTTPHAIIGIKGTSFYVYVFPGYTKVVLIKGKLEYSYPRGNKPPSTKMLNFVSTSQRKKEPFSEKPPEEIVQVEVIFR